MEGQEEEEEEEECKAGALTPRLPGPVHGDLDGALVSGHLRGVCEDGDGESEALPCGGRHTLIRTNSTQRLPSLLPRISHTVCVHQARSHGDGRGERAAQTDPVNTCPGLTTH